MVSRTIGIHVTTTELSGSEGSLGMEATVSTLERRNRCCRDPRYVAGLRRSRTIATRPHQWEVAEP